MMLTMQHTQQGFNCNTVCLCTDGRDVSLINIKRQGEKFLIFYHWLRRNTKPKGKKVKLKVQYRMITKWTMMHENIIKGVLAEKPE